MADANININIETASLDQLNAKLETLTAEIKKVPVGSAEFKKLSAEIRKVDGAVGSANKKLKSLDVGAVAGDIAKLGGAVASSAALFKQFGEEGSSSQEAIQSALETTNTILGAGAIAEGVASAARLAGVAATEAASAAQAAYATVVGTSTGALKAFRIALAATGIGAIVVLIGALIANWDKLTSTVKSSAQELEEFSKTAESTLANLESIFSEKFAEIDKAFAEGASFNEGLQKRRDAYNNLLNGPNGLVSLAKKAGDEFTKITWELFQYEDKLRQEGKSEEEIAEDEKYKKLVETSDKAQKLSDDLNARKVKAEIDLIKLEKEAANERIAGYEIEADKRRIAAKDNELELIKIEKDLQAKKLAEMTRANKFTQQEIDKQKNAVDKAAQDEADYFIKVQKEKLDAERQYLNDRAALLNVTYEERLATIDKNYSAELKTIKKAGLSQAEIDAKTQSLNLKYSFERIKVVQEEETKKLELVRDSVTKRLELEAKAAETVGDVEKVKQIQQAIDTVRKETDAAIAAADAEAKKRLDDLLAAGKITEDAYKKAVQDLTKINTDFKTEVTKSVTVGGEGIVSKAIDSVISKFDTTLNETITNLGIAGDKAEKEFLNSISGKGRGEVDRLQQEFLKKQIQIRKQVAQATIDSVDQEIKALESLTGLSVQEEEDRSKKILELRAKRSKAELELAKTTAQSEKEIQDRRLAEVESYFTEIQKYYQSLAASIQAIGNYLADQAAIQDLRYTEEIEKVQQVYDEKFKLIDEEEQKLDDLEQAKETNLSATERKRRALAKERAALEAKQQEELTQLENARANAAADAAIKQAEVNFALATGQIIISTAEAVAKSIAESPATFGLPFSAFAVIQGGIQLAAANSARQAAIAQANASRPGVSGAENVRVTAAKGGLISGPGNGVSDSVPANLSNGEFVVNANATRRFLPLLNSINQSGLQGGNPVNPSSFSDSEAISILNEIRNQLAQPTRSYVVTSDIENIQNKQNYINRRANIL